MLLTRSLVRRFRQLPSRTLAWGMIHSTLECISTPSNKLEISGEEIAQPFPTLSLKSSEMPFKLTLADLTAFIDYDDGEPSGRRTVPLIQ